MTDCMGESGEQRGGGVKEWVRRGVRECACECV